MKSDELDYNGVAALLGVSDRQIRTYLTAGLPSTTRGRKRVFDRAEVVAWHERYLTDLQLGASPDDDEEDEDDEPSSMRPGSAAAKEKDDIRKVNLRRATADAELKEIALSEKRAEVIPIAEARDRLTRMFTNLRTQLLGMAPKLATRLAGVKDPTEMEALIKDEMETLCRELSTGAIVGHVPDPEADDTGAVDLSAAADGGLTDRQLNRLARKVERAYAAE